MYGFLARTASVLIGISLADAVGDRRTQNVPGTTDEYPNWRVPLCDSEGKAVLIEDLPDVEAAQGRRQRGDLRRAALTMVLASRPGRQRGYLRRAALTMVLASRPGR